MLAWHFGPPVPAGTRLATRRAAVRAGRGLVASPCPLEALLWADGSTCSLVELGGEIERRGLAFLAQTRTHLAAFDAAAVLTEWATACGCPERPVRASPTAAAAAWSPGRTHPDYLAASDELDAWLARAMQAAAELAAAPAEAA